MKALVVLSVAAIAIAMIAHSAQAWPGTKQVSTTSYDLSPGGALAVEDSSGDVSVTGWDEKRVEVTETKSSWSSDDLSRLQTQVANGASSLAVNAVYPDDCNNCDISYAIRAPRGAHLSIDTASGDITVRELSGPVSAQTSSGDVHAGDLTGIVQLHSSSGSISIANATAAVQAVCSSGDIEATGLSADADLSSDSGDVSASFASLGGVKQIRLQSDSGDLKFTMPRGAGFRVQATTSSGSINTNLRLPVDDRDSGADTAAQVGSGGPDVQLRDDSGDVSIMMR